MQIMSAKWWINTFIQTFIVMIFIWMIKKGSNKFNIPFVKDVSNDL